MKYEVGSKCVLGTVVKARDTKVQPLSKRTMLGNKCKRSRYLLTVRNGEGKCQQVYDCVVEDKPKNSTNWFHWALIFVSK